MRGVTAAAPATPHALDSVAATGLQLALIWAATPAAEPEVMNKPGSIIAAAAGIAVLSGFGFTHHHTATATHTAGAVTTTVHQVSHPTAAAAAHPASHTPAAAAAGPGVTDPALAWLASPGGQAQVTFNNQVTTLAADLNTENGSPTVANHLIFEADARAVRAQAEKILTAPALLPTVNRAAYQHMLTDYITVANLLQPGPGYGTTPQDDTAWTAAMNASNITIS